MFVGVFKEEYRGGVRMVDYNPIVVQDIIQDCINANGEDFSYLYTWFILDTEKLEEIQ
ncbi:hypothetical protein NVP1187O_137 [Vibrio phage 1.187.O._10N.286.49.F1]|nr:hypothetical protein NVP1187O_137 [Vibrio phage 1.187.O._10N.286.49.F1]